MKFYFSFRPFKTCIRGWLFARFEHATKRPFGGGFDYVSSEKHRSSALIGDSGLVHTICFYRGNFRSSAHLKSRTNGENLDSGVGHNALLLGLNVLQTSQAEISFSCSAHGEPRTRHPPFSPRTADDGDPSQFQIPPRRISGYSRLAGSAREC